MEALPATHPLAVLTLRLLSCFRDFFLERPESPRVDWAAWNLSALSFYRADSEVIITLGVDCVAGRFSAPILFAGSIWGALVRDRLGLDLRSLIPPMSVASSLFETRDRFLWRASGILVDAASHFEDLDQLEALYCAKLAAPHLHRDPEVALRYQQLTGAIRERVITPTKAGQMGDRDFGCEQGLRAFLPYLEPQDSLEAYDALGHLLGLTSHFGSGEAIRIFQRVGEPLMNLAKHAATAAYVKEPALCCLDVLARSLFCASAYLELKVVSRFLGDQGVDTIGNLVRLYESQLATCDDDARATWRRIEELQPHFYPRIRLIGLEAAQSSATWNDVQAIAHARAAWELLLNAQATTLAVNRKQKVSGPPHIDAGIPRQLISQALALVPSRSTSDHPRVKDYATVFYVAGLVEAHSGELRQAQQMFAEARNLLGERLVTDQRISCRTIDEQIARLASTG